MPNLTVKNIPADLYERLKAAAATQRRSINSQILVCLERALGSQQIDPEERISRARRLREMTAESPVSDEDLERMKNAGRP